MKLFIFFLPALFLMAGCATLKDKGLEPNYEVFVQKSLTKLSESDLFIIVIQSTLIGMKLILGSL